MRRGARLPRCAAFLLCACAGAAQAQEPYTPANDAVVLEHVGLPRAPGVLQLREVRTQWLAEPGNYALALAYARVALDVGRQEDDPRYFGYAESALRPWLERPQPPPEARLLRASLRQVRKDFAGATQDLDALAADPGPEAVQALLARAGLRLIQGDPAAAEHDCQDLQGRADPLLQSICVNAARALSGNAAASLAALDALRAPAAKAALPVQAWLLGVSAGIEERLGRADAALRDYAQAGDLLTAAGTRDPGLLAAYADCLLEQGQPATVITVLAGMQRIDALLLRLALAERRLGDAGDAALAERAGQHAALLSLRFEEARQRGDSLHLREEALFQLALKHDAARALQLAQQDWQLQREPVDARIFLRAALAADNRQAAQPVLERLRQTRLEDRYLKPLVAQLAGGAVP